MKADEKHEKQIEEKKGGETKMISTSKVALDRTYYPGNKLAVSSKDSQISGYLVLYRR